MSFGTSEMIQKKAATQGAFHWYPLHVPERGEEMQEGHTGNHDRAGRISWLIGTVKTESFGVFLAIPTALWDF